MSAHVLRIAGLLCLVFIAGCATRFDVQGHRGARGLAPENTLIGFQRALALGVDTLELDVGVTLDGVVVVYHDRTLNADITRDAAGGFLAARGAPIAALTFAQLQQFDVGRIAPQSAYAKTFARQTPHEGSRIPTLQSVLKLVKSTFGADSVRLNIETKLSPLAPTETRAPEPFAQAVLDVISAENMQARVSIQSFDWRTLAAVHTLAPKVQTVFLSTEQGAGDTVQRGKAGASPFLSGRDVDDFGGSVPALIAALGGSVWSPNARDLTPNVMTDAKQRGLRVIPWTVNTEDDMRRLIALGVDGLITDYPDVLLRVLGRAPK